MSDKGFNWNTFVLRPCYFMLVVEHTLQGQQDGKYYHCIFSVKESFPDKFFLWAAEVRALGFILSHHSIVERLVHISSSPELLPEGEQRGGSGTNGSGLWGSGDPALPGPEPAKLATRKCQA